MDGEGEGAIFLDSFRLRFVQAFLPEERGVFRKNFLFARGGERIMKFGRIIPEAETDGDIPSARSPLCGGCCAREEPFL